MTQHPCLLSVIEQMAACRTGCIMQNSVSEHSLKVWTAVWFSLVHPLLLFTVHKHSCWRGFYSHECLENSSFSYEYPYSCANKGICVWTRAFFIHHWLFVILYSLLSCLKMFVIQSRCGNNVMWPRWPDIKLKISTKHPN